MIKKLNLRPLHTCKQIYAEARANTFSLSSASIFKEFFRPLLLDKVRALRTLHLEVNLTNNEHAIEWTRIFHNHRLDSHNSSKSLKFHTLDLFLTLNSPIRHNSRLSLGLSFDFWVTRFFRVQQRQLKHETVKMDSREESDSEEQEEEPVDADFVDFYVRDCLKSRKSVALAHSSLCSR